MADKTGCTFENIDKIHEDSTHNMGPHNNTPTCVLPSGVGDLACIACYVSCFVKRVQI